MLWYKESGDKAHKKIIFLHGLLASAQNWQVVSKRLSNEYHTFCLDLPNHGHSMHSEASDYEFMLDELVKFIELKKIEKFHLVGHSLGGKLAMLYALKFPEKIEGLVIEDIAPKAYPMKYLPLMQVMDNLKLSQYTKRLEIDRVLEEHIPDKAVRLFLLTNLEKKGERYEWRVNLKSLIANAENLMSFPINQSEYEKPTLFLCGSESDYVPKKDKTIIMKYFPDCEIYYIEGASHWLHAEKPDVFSIYLKSYFEKL